MERLGGKEQLVVCTAASKTFNIAGLQCSAILIPGEKLREKYREILMRQHFMEMNGSYGGGLPKRTGVAG